jgi:hypothetical protein
MRRQLDARALALFGSDEDVVATFNGYTRLPGARYLGNYLVSYGSGSGGVGIWIHAHHWDAFARSFGRHQIEFGLTEIGVGLLIRLICRLAGARAVMVALTSDGVAVCGVDWLRRPRSVLSRGPIVRPRIVSRGHRFLRVAIGPVAFDCSKGSEAVLDWAARPWLPRSVPLTMFADAWRPPSG